MKEEIIFDENSFNHEIYKVIDPCIKTFLSDYFGQKLLYLEPETYSKIETAIKNNIYFQADILPDILFSHCTIDDSDKRDEAFENFINDKLPIPWQDLRHWFDRDFGSDNNNDENDDTFLEDAYDFELNEDQQKAKTVIKAADSILNNTQNLALFMHTGYQVVTTVTRQFLINNCIFDLKYLSVQGFVDLQKQMDMMNEMILEDLFEIIHAE